MGRISYEATEKRLRREFEEYGPIKRIRLVQEKDTGAAPLLGIIAMSNAVQYALLSAEYGVQGGLIGCRY